MKTPTNPRGAGAKPKPPALKKLPFGTRLPAWLLAKLADEPEPAAALIERALCQAYGWTPPVVTVPPK